MDNNSNFGGMIVIVDDVTENLQVLGSILDSSGYDTAFALNGPEALTVIGELLPDLVLLDISMPGMDGFEVCRHLKADPKTADIPVIFLTAFSEQEYITRGFEVGAVDYVSKPFRQGELLSRVKTHLSLRYAMRALAERNQDLTELVKEKNELITIATHDIKSPLQGIVLSVEVIKSLVRRGMFTEVNGQLDSILKTADKIRDILKNWLDLNAAEAGAMQFTIMKLNAASLLYSTGEFYRQKAEVKNIKLEITADEPDIPLYADEAAMQAIIDNLISNAIKFSNGGSTVRLQVGSANGRTIFEVADEGPGILPEEMSLLFKKFGRLSARPTGGEHSTGLGLAIVKRLVETMKGTICCESEYGRGTTFVVELPGKP